MDPLEYTNQELEKQLNLLELHLKQAGHEKEFCNECIRKHLLTIEGLAEEGIGFSNNPEKYAGIAVATREIRNSVDGAIELSKKIREIRKSLNNNCSTCPKIEIEKIEKDLNNKGSINNQLNTKKNKMAEYQELAIMNAGQFAAEGIRYLVETQKPEWDKYVSIGGGIALQALGVFVRLPPIVKNISLVAGSNLLANGVVKMVREAGTTVVATRQVTMNPNYAPAFGGPVFGGAITAQNIPSRYARAGIMVGAQQFESPEHADLIRVD